MPPLQRKPAAKAREAGYPGRITASSGDRGAPSEGPYHRVSVSNVVCGDCGKATRAPLPEEIAGRFGPQLTALIAYWTVVCRLPRRLVEAMLADVLGIEISLGSTQKRGRKSAKPWHNLFRNYRISCRGSGPECGRDGLADQWRQALAVGLGGTAVCVLCGGVHAGRRSAGSLAGLRLPPESVQ